MCLCLFSQNARGKNGKKKKTKKINIGASGNGKFALLSRLSRQSTSNSRYKVFFKISCKYRDLYIYIYIKRKKNKKKNLSISLSRRRRCETTDRRSEGLR